MRVSEQESERFIAALAQCAPFRFIDKVVYLDESRVETELHGHGMPHRFVDIAAVETGALLEFAAQSSGLLLRGRKQGGGRGVISSFRDVKRDECAIVQFPLRLESRLIDQRWSLFEFEFKVRSGEDLVIMGNINIAISR